MKRLLLIIGIACITFACSKKEDIKPLEVNQRAEEVDNSGMVKVTTWSNRAGYTYKRKPYKKDWIETVVPTKTAVFYEEYCHCIDGSLKSTEYAMFATHNYSEQKGDSIRITIEYQAKKATNLNLRGLSYAITHLIDMK